MPFFIKNIYFAIKLPQFFIQELKHPPYSKSFRTACEENMLPLNVNVTSKNGLFTKRKILLDTILDLCYLIYNSNKGCDKDSSRAEKP